MDEFACSPDVESADKSDSAEVLFIVDDELDVFVEFADIGDDVAGGDVFANSEDELNEY